MSEDAQTLARSLGHPFTRAIALSYAALLQQFLRDTAAAGALCEQAISLCNEHGFSYYRTWAQIVRGWCLAEQATAPDAVMQIIDGIVTLTEACARRQLPYFHSLLAEVHLKRGALDQADRSIAMGLQIAAGTGECWWQPELLRLKGAVSLASSPQDSAEARSCTRAAFDLASQHGNKSLMLRAATALAGLPASPD
jgi:predicted ATPase